MKRLTLRSTADVYLRIRKPRQSHDCCNMLQRKLLRRLMDRSLGMLLQLLSSGPFFPRQKRPLQASRCVEPLFHHGFCLSWFERDQQFDIGLGSDAPKCQGDNSKLCDGRTLFSSGLEVGPSPSPEQGCTAPRTLSAARRPPASDDP